MSKLHHAGKFAVATVLLIILGGICHWAGAADQVVDAKAAKLVIVKAEYGDLDADKTADVTAKVAALVKDNSLYVEVNKASLGAAAPAGAPPKLKVGYTIDGIYRSKTADEGQPLDISTRLVILSAVYGSLPNGSKADVTDQVAAMVKKNRLVVEATNDNFGDPAGGVVKHLRVDYMLDGVKKSATVGENQTLTVGVEPSAKEK